MKPGCPVWVVLLGLLASASSLSAAENATDVKLTPLADRVRIEIGGKLFSEYVFSGAPRPYLYPVLAADGTGLTRDWPQRETTNEEHDHLQHRSLWFAHGAVNGHDFWREIAGTGHVEHEGVPDITSGAVGVVHARDRWVAADGKLVCTDDVTIRVRATPAARMLDYDIILRALPDAPLVFGDSKEGTMAIRVAQWMTLPGPGSGQAAPIGAGHIVLSTGLRDNATWGKPGEWCDFYAPHEGRVLGVAIFNHPNNPRHPTRWMVRGYGLFAAGPFGQHDFDPKEPVGSGDFTIPAGGSATLRYRFYLHEGDTAAAEVAARYQDYAAGK